MHNSSFQNLTSGIPRWDDSKLRREEFIAKQVIEKKTRVMKPAYPNIIFFIIKFFLRYSAITDISPLDFLNRWICSIYE